MHPLSDYHMPTNLGEIQFAEWQEHSFVLGILNYSKIKKK